MALEILYHRKAEIIIENGEQAVIKFVIGLFFYVFRALLSGDYQEIQLEASRILLPRSSTTLHPLLMWQKKLQRQEANLIC